MKKKVLTCISVGIILAAINVFAGFKFVPNEETKFCGSSEYTEESETITYARKETESYSIKGDVPSYYNQTSYTSCANIAGTAIIGYYDRFCEELIPNYQTYFQIGSVIMYRGIGFDTQAVMESLYTSMGTDVGAAGTTFEGFHKGMKSYVNEHGYAYSTEDLGNVDLNKYKAAVQNDKPVALFLLTYSFAVAGQDDGSTEIIKSKHCSVAHVVVGCGYKIDTYYNANGQVVATRTYLKVASGLDQFSICYLCLDGKSSIYKATSVTVQ